MGKTRLDLWLTENERAPSRQRAQALVLAGAVYINDQKATSVAQPIRDGDHVEVREKDHPYVSRGGVKLVHALDHFSIDLSDKVAVDIGASTGGFTDCLLQKGARKVYAVDVGHGQLDWQLRQDERVVCIERCNARHWQADEVTDRIGFICIDVSFISIQKVLPNIFDRLQSRFESEVDLVALIKPQFEAERSEIASGGVVRDLAVQERVVSEAENFIRDQGWSVRGVIPAPIKGPKGNQEYLLVASR